MFSQLQFPLVFSGYVNVYEEAYSNCSASFSCGNFTGIGYPFWRNDQPDYCGHPGFKLDCQGERATIDINSHKYDIIEIYHDTQILKIAKADFMLNICPVSFINSILEFNLFEYTFSDQNASLLYNCDHLTEDHQPRLQEFTCPINNWSSNCYFTAPAISSNDEFSSRCKITLLIPVLAFAVERFTIYLWNFDQVIKEGFEVKWIIDQGPCNDCLISRGKCGYNRTINDFTCFCPYQPSPRTCSRTQPPANSAAANPSTAPGVASAGIGVLTVTCIIIRCYGFNISSIISNSIFRKLSKDDQDLESVINNYGPLAPKRYSFSYIKKMSNSFKHKLGQGGYGSVFKGKLPDGRLVAVKLLNTSKENVQEFVNEVASISRTSHVNVVTLLGFCLEGSKRALVYEYMPNGSLEKFIHNGDTSKAHQRLGWEKFYHIAIETARGLEYLHRGCNTKILHLDIKPHNILLDEEFCPKISDFGLAKLCPRKESNVSLFEASGTIGYVAPEVLSRSFGEVSHKSDVYSYGMMILEMVGCKNNPDAGVDETSDVYFPHWIYKHVEQGKVFKLPSVMSSNENEIEIAKKMVIVGLWCIQTHPSYRPAMNKVIDMVQGSIEALQIPPKPFLSPPRLSSMDSSFTSMA